MRDRAKRDREIRREGVRDTLDEIQTFELNTFSPMVMQIKGSLCLERTCTCNSIGAAFQGLSA